MPWFFFFFLFLLAQCVVRQVLHFLNVFVVCSMSCIKVWYVCSMNVLSVVLLKDSFLDWKF